MGLKVVTRNTRKLRVKGDLLLKHTGSYSWVLTATHAIHTNNKSQCYSNPQLPL